MEKKKQQQKESSNVEFGMEFGDLNSSNLYEITLNQKGKKNKQTEKK
jgi:hypothetical protein